jgi:uncharacterized protein
MKLSLSGLPKRGKVVLSTEKSAPEFEISPTIFFQPIIINAELESVGEAILCRAKLNTVSRLICDRCAREFDFPLTVEINFKFLQKTGGSNLKDTEEVKYYFPDKPEIDISSDLRDELLLAIPMKILCREDCQGLCSRCGADLNFEICNCNNLIKIETE